MFLCFGCMEVFDGDIRRKRCTLCFKARNLSRQRDYRKTPSGRAGMKLSKAAYDKTENGKIAKHFRMSRYRQGAGGIREQEYQRSYRSTPKGLAMVSRANARNNSKRREAPGNPNNVGDLSFEIHTVGRPCVKCGLPSQEVDHIFPIALGGSHDWENLQPLCRECHKLKTADDLRFISLLRVP